MKGSRHEYPGRAPSNQKEPNERKKKGVWDEDAVVEFRILKAKMNEQGIDVFIGRVFVIRKMT